VVIETNELMFVFEAMNELPLGQEVFIILIGYPLLLPH
jgi:hypothetical protein